MCVAGEIEVVDLCPFEDGCLLRPDMRREEQEPVVGVIGWQVHSAAIQLLDFDSDVLMTEMRLLLDKVPKVSLKCFPSHDSVEARQCFPGARISALGSHLWRAGLYRSRSGAISDRAMFIKIQRALIMNKSM